MKRSQVNALLEDAKAFFADRNFHLPPFAFWKPEDWQKKGPECNEIREAALGWDVTDFGSGDFFQTGLLLFTLRNGNPIAPEQGKSYCEKIMITREHQVTPLHCHWNKREDIINRAGASLAMQIFAGDPNEKTQITDKNIEISKDGEKETLEAGTTVILEPGSSITLEPLVYHKFWAEGGTVLTGEVSEVNDDTADNIFYDAGGRFFEPEEDESPLHYLCWEYPNPQQG